MVKISEKGENVTFKIYENKITIHDYEDFESILVPEDTEKQNPEGSYTKKYQKHVPCSYGYESVYVDNRFSLVALLSQVKILLIVCLINKRKYCCGMMTNNFKEGLKKDEDFKNSMDCWICDNVFMLMVTLN